MSTTMFGRSTVPSPTKLIDADGAIHASRGRLPGAKRCRCLRQREMASATSRILAIHGPEYGSETSRVSAAAQTPARHDVGVESVPAPSTAGMRRPVAAPLDTRARW